MTDKMASYIGLAQRAGGVLYGEDIMTQNAGKLKLALVDARAPEKYVQRHMRRITTCETFVVEGLREALHRDAVNAIGIVNCSLAEAIIKLLR